MSVTRLELGKAGEQAGVSYLKKIGFKILEINYRTFLGEIDCIARDKDATVFIEIKTRNSSRYGAPEEAVDVRKQRKMTQVAQIYLKKHGLIDKGPVRFDVLAIQGIEGGQPGFNHIKHAFEIESKENT